MSSETWLVPEDHRFPTPNVYSPTASPLKVAPIDVVVIHYTAGGDSLSWLRNPTSKASAHFLIDRDGLVMQLAPFEWRTWHAGGTGSLWRGVAGVNQRSIGIEIENWGFLTRRRDQWHRHTGAHHPGPIYLDEQDRAWEAYAEPQLTAVIELCLSIAQHFPVLRQGGSRWVGHQHVDPGRKQDPGPAFPWVRFRDEVL